MRYDTDWSALGPLLERYKITVRYTSWGWEAEFPPLMDYNPPHIINVAGDTPLTAACMLILALAEAGKLPKE